VTEEGSSPKSSETVNKFVIGAGAILHAAESKGREKCGLLDRAIEGRDQFGTDKIRAGKNDAGGSRNKQVSQRFIWLGKFSKPGGHVGIKLMLKN